MRKNLPVTEKEQTFPQAVKLITITDTDSIIKDCNNAFAEISGFSKEELIGQPHNIVRHPDMPPEVFKRMWQHLKAGKPWMGLVKNRTKNGDFYWVDAYVTPVTEKGKVVGYESVRSCPSREDVQRAEALYKAMQQGRKSTGIRWPFPLSFTALFVVLCLGWGLWLTLPAWTALSFLSVSLVVYAIAKHHKSSSDFARLREIMGSTFDDEYAVKSYTDNSGALGQLMISIRSQASHLDAVLTRIEEAASQVALQTERGFALSQNTSNQVESQQSETMQVATAMNEMTQTINEVAKHVGDTAASAENAMQLAKSGTAVAEKTHQAIQDLKETVVAIGNSVQSVSEQTDNIAKAAQIIEQIAEQTNLLALNAAIEAARAGEQGRGFAVVADEVRSLAHRTQTSTKDIYQIVNDLTQKARNAVEVADAGAQGAEEGLSRVIESSSMLSGISESIIQIADMSTQMASAVEQQAHVAEDINRQIVAISELADESTGSTSQLVDTIRDLNVVSDDLHELVARFRK